MNQVMNNISNQYIEQEEIDKKDQTEAKKKELVLFDMTRNQI